MRETEIEEFLECFRSLEAHPTTFLAAPFLSSGRYTGPFTIPYSLIIRKHCVPRLSTQGVVSQWRRADLNIALMKIYIFSQKG